LSGIPRSRNVSSTRSISPRRRKLVATMARASARSRAGKSNIHPVASERLRMSSSGCFLSMTADKSSTAARRAGRPTCASRAAAESRVPSSKLIWIVEAV
jgi:hypothetical protein